MKQRQQNELYQEIGVAQATLKAIQQQASNDKTTVDKSLNDLGKRVGKVENTMINLQIKLAGAGSIGGVVALVIGELIKRTN